MRFHAASASATKVPVELSRHASSSPLAAPVGLLPLARERGAAAFSGCVLLAHYVLPAPPRSWPLHRQQEAKKAEMAPMEGFWMEKLDARTSGFNKKSEGLCMD